MEENKTWSQLCAFLGVDEKISAEWWEIILQRYQESGRAYHTLQHIRELLAYHASLQQQLSPGTSLRIQCAIWFHDLVYDARALDNEAQSAAVFSDFVKSARSDALSGAVANDVHRWILATANHTAARQDASDPDLALFLDMDLAILGNSPERYAEYATAIRAEYAFVPPLLYCEKRQAVLQKLASVPVFATAHFQHMEAAARCNLEREIAELGEGGWRREAMCAKSD